MRTFLSLILCIVACSAFAARPMMYGDTSRRGVPFSKDPHVVEFDGHYLMYYSIPPGSTDKGGMEGWGIGIARSDNLRDWHRIGEIVPAASYEAKGLCAPGAIFRNDTIHLFYQTYGNGSKDAICHATSTDGVTFVRDATNPMFSPSGDWNCGGAINAEGVSVQRQILPLLCPPHARLLDADYRRGRRPRQILISREESGLPIPRALSWCPNIRGKAGVPKGRRSLPRATKCLCSMPVPTIITLSR